jgi:hypothetical protein
MTASAKPQFQGSRYFQCTFELIALQSIRTKKHPALARLQLGPELFQKAVRVMYDEFSPEGEGNKDLWKYLSSSPLSSTGEIVKNSLEILLPTREAAARRTPTLLQIGGKVDSSRC